MTNMNDDIISKSAVLALEIKNQYFVDEGIVSIKGAYTIDDGIVSKPQNAKIDNDII
ncbi:hypothetical protein [Alteromonas ponticola]|uniref:Uncharacterized protein n=1 Tax=Alteromonas ponticola TaxID=2720613 RepID=A0ABX1R695_9ALTE|nr:hypothetical protein [Alteromonas ponticola]NMH61011.1 hypothetical protein [Alteromonas ponticola]